MSSFESNSEYYDVAKSNVLNLPEKEGTIPASLPTDPTVLKQLLDKVIIKQANYEKESNKRIEDLTNSVKEMKDMVSVLVSTMNHLVMKKINENETTNTANEITVVPINDGLSSNAVKLTDNIIGVKDESTLENRNCSDTVTIVNPSTEIIVGSTSGPKNIETSESSSSNVITTIDITACMPPVVNLSSPSPSTKGTTSSIEKHEDLEYHFCIVAREALAVLVDRVVQIRKQYPHIKAWLVVDSEPINVSTTFNTKSMDNFIIWVPDQEIQDAGWTHLNVYGKLTKPICAWERATYWAYKHNYPFTWFAEDDVYWPRPMDIASIFFDHKNCTADLVATPIAMSRSQFPQWYHWKFNYGDDFFPNKEEQAATLNVLSRMSHKLLSAAAKIGEEHQRLTFHEVFWISLVKHSNGALTFSPFFESFRNMLRYRPTVSKEEIKLFKKQDIPFVRDSSIVIRVFHPVKYLLEPPRFFASLGNAVFNRLYSFVHLVLGYFFY